MRGDELQAGQQLTLSLQNLLPKTFRHLPWLSRVCSVNGFGAAWRLLRNAQPHRRVHICRGFCLVRAELSLLVLSALSRWQPGTLSPPHFRSDLGELFGSYTLGRSRCTSSPTSHILTIKHHSKRGRQRHSKNHGHVILQTDSIQQLHKSPGRWAL